MKQKLLLALLALFTLGGSNLFAQTDVTSTYLTNADFEGEYSVYSNPSADRAIYQPSGWTIEYNNGEANDMTSLNSNCTQWNQFSGKAQPTDGGNNTYWIRFRWGNNESLQLSQKATLPKGAYILSAEAFFNGSTAVAEISAAGQSTTITKKDAWNNYNVIFNIEEDGTEVTIAFTFSQKSQVESIVGYDNVKLVWFSDKDELLRYQNSLTDASASNGVATNFVVNGTFTDNVNGWTANGGFQNSNRASNQNGDFTVPFWENWNGSAKANKMYQTINNIPNGTYKLKIAAFVNTLANPNESQYVFANDDKTYLTTGAPTFYEVWTVVTNNTIEIGLEQTTATANWMGIDNVSLTYYGAGDVISQAQAGAHKTDWEEALAAAQAAVDNSDYANVTGKELVDLNTEIAKDEPTTAEGYDEAAAALRSATQAFIAAKDNYDALVAEIAKAEALGVENTDDYAATAETTAATALTNTQNLKVAEYNYVTTTYQYGVDLGEWTSTGTNTKAADFSNEHWSGTQHSYKNQDDSNGQGWNANSWSINFSQDVTLPAGNYVFKVAGRQATGDQVNTSLVVKQGENELGSVNDFPRGNASRGINKSGATSFTEDNDAYANNGNGYGWEWRYVKFTLSEEATVNIAINSVATASHQWVSFGDYTVQTDNEANISLIAYNIALNNAKTTLANSDYANVTGEEKTALKAAIAADETLDKTSKEAIEAATTALTNATSTFTAAKVAYDTFIDAKNESYEDKLKYASAEKYAAIATAQAAADATSAADATAKTNAILSAYRKYVESHALAEGVEGATQFAITDANMEVEYDSENHKFGAWQVIGQTNGTIKLLSDQSFTDGDGKNDYKYADIYKNDNNAGIQQSISLEPGKYMLSVTARANTTSGAGFQLFAGDKTAEISRIGNAGGTFDRGWNDTNLEFVVNETADVNIGVQSYNGKDLWWSATRFRLVKLPTDEVTLLDAATEIPVASDFANVTYARNLTAGYNSLILPFEVTKDELGDVKRILEFEGSEKAAGEDFKLNFKEVEKVEANKPYLVEMNAATIDGLNFTSKVVAPAENLSMGDENFMFVGSYVALEKGNDVIKAGDYGCATTGLKKAKDGIAMKAFRAYMKNNTNNPEAGVRVFVDGEEATGIQAVEILESLTDGIYNLQGQKVNKAQKGVYIVNGKKVILK